VVEARGGADVVDVALTHPRSEGAADACKVAIEDVAGAAHPLDFPGAHPQARRSDLPGQVELPDACQQEVDDTRRRRVDRTERVNANRLRVMVAQHGGEYHAQAWRVSGIAPPGNHTR
jgi:hypothetical protein